MTVVRDFGDEDELADYVIAANVTRRNMSTGARAMATALVLDAAGRRNSGRWKRGSVQVGNGESSITDGWIMQLKQAGTVIDHRPDLAEPVTRDELALDRAYRDAVEARDTERNAALLGFGPVPV